MTPFQGWRGFSPERAQYTSEAVQPLAKSRIEATIQLLYDITPRESVNRVIG